MNSLWIETTKNELNVKSLEKDEETEICVIGAGLFGLTTAYYLSKQGKKVIVLEKGEIGEKVSGHTTGKITSQHGLFYDHLIKDYGEEYAHKYLQANEDAIKNIKEIIEKEKIECEFSERQGDFVNTLMQCQDETIITLCKNIKIPKDYEYKKDTNTSLLRIVITEGKYHQVKNMCDAVGLPVKKLTRLRFAMISTEGLAKGEYRKLKIHEVKQLHNL